MAMPTQYARVALNFVDADKKVWQNIFWFQLTGTFGGSYDIAAAVNALEANISTQLLAVLSEDSTYLGMDVRINNNGVSSDSSTYPADAVGTGDAGSIPNEVAAVVHWQTAQPGGSGRGRSFFTGFAAAEVAGGRVSSTFNTTIGALATKLKTAFVNQGITWGLQVLSRKLDTMFPVGSFVVDALVGTQRKRRPLR